MSLTNNARREVLARAGIPRGGDGYDLAQLESLARERGWTVTTTPTTTYHGRPGRWRASVAVPAPRGGRFSFSLNSRGSGLTEAEALAAALSTALARESPASAKDAA